MVYHQLFKSQGSQINYPHNVVPASLMLENTIPLTDIFVLPQNRSCVLGIVLTLNGEIKY